MSFWYHLRYTWSSAENGDVEEQKDKEKFCAGGKMRMSILHLIMKAQFEAGLMMNLMTPMMLGLLCAVHVQINMMKDIINFMLNFI